MALSAFEIMGLVVRPYLSPDELKKKFLALSFEIHPDRVHHLSREKQIEATSKFITLNEAFRILSDPKLRLQEVFFILTGRKSQYSQVPELLMELSFEVGTFCNELVHYLQKTASAPTQLEKAMLRSQRQQWRSRLQIIIEKVGRSEELIQNELLELDRMWVLQGDHEKETDRLQHLIAAFSYLSKSKHNLMEKSVELETF